MVTGGSGVLLLSEIAARRHVPKAPAGRLITPTPERRRTEWPDAHAFREAVQDLARTAADPELTGGEVALDRFGLPIAYTGRFAIVFRLRLPDGTIGALRCFTSANDHDLRAERFRLLEERLTEAGDLDGALVPFRYLDEAVRVAGVPYPALLMRWADGLPLREFLEAHYNQPDTLRTLAHTLDRLLTRLESAGISHGDWQHDNLIVSEGGRRVTLVDYDGLQIAGLRGFLAGAPEIGHPSYQHPRRGPEHAGIGLDRFAHAVLTTALFAIAREPSLWERWAGEDDRVLFGRRDFMAPEASPVFAEVAALSRADARLTAALERLYRHCALPEPEIVAPLDTASPVRHGTTPWYRQGIEEAVAAAAPTGAAGLRARVRTDGGSKAAAARRLSYRERLEGKTERERERRNLRALRVFVAGAVPIIAGLWALAATIEAANGAPWFFAALATACAFYWLLTGFYLTWPRKRLSDELALEIGRLMHERADRAVRAAFLRDAAARACTDAIRPIPNSQEARRRAEEELCHLPISRALRVPGVTAATVRAARTVGIETALGLVRRGMSSGLYDSLAPEQTALLRAWCRRLLSHHEAVYRDALTPGRTETRAAEACEESVRTLDVRLAALATELEAFPRPSLIAYLRRASGRIEG